MDLNQSIQLICIWVLPVLFAVTMHEAAHGWVAYKLGDNTAYLAGRITANPLKHIDWLGTVIVPMILLLTTSFLFGWAKPVPVDGRNLRHPRRDFALVAAAGPLSNLLMAIIWILFLKLGIVLVEHKIQMGVPLVLMSKAGVMINLFLMALNLIPIPPLDGSRVVSSLLSPRLEQLYNKITPYGFLILLALLLTNILTVIIMPIVNFFLWLLQTLFL